MARISGVEVPKNKRSVIGLTYLYGIGRTSASAILEKAKIDENKRVAELSTEEITTITRIIAEEYKIEGDLRTEKRLNIKRLMEIGCRRGKRHREHRKLRGQRTQQSGRGRFLKTKKNPITKKKKATK